MIVVVVGVIVRVIVISVIVDIVTVDDDVGEHAAAHFVPFGVVGVNGVVGVDVVGDGCCCSISVVLQRCFGYW